MGRAGIWGTVLGVEFSELDRDVGATGSGIGALV